MRSIHFKIEFSEVSVGFTALFLDRLHIEVLDFEILDYGVKSGINAFWIVEVLEYCTRFCHARAHKY